MAWNFETLVGIRMRDAEASSLGKAGYLESEIAMLEKETVMSPSSEHQKLTDEMLGATREALNRLSQSSD